MADRIGQSAPQVSRMLKEERKRWKRCPAVQALRAEIIELLADLGRVAPAAEIADALALRRGTQLAEREQRRALALAAVQAVVEVEQLAPENAEFQHQPNCKATEEPLGAGLLALDAREADEEAGLPGDPADTPTPRACRTKPQRPSQGQIPRVDLQPRRRRRVHGGCCRQLHQAIAKVTQR